MYYYAGNYYRSNLSVKVVENVYVETQTVSLTTIIIILSPNSWFVQGERNINLFLTDGSDNGSLHSYNTNTNDYTVTNATVVVGDEKDPLGLVEAVGQELEAKEASMCFKSDEESLKETCLHSDMEQQQPQDPQPSSQPCQDIALDLEITQM